MLPNIPGVGSRCPSGVRSVSRLLQNRKPEFLKHPIWGFILAWVPESFGRAHSCLDGKVQLIAVWVIFTLWETPDRPRLGRLPGLQTFPRARFRSAGRDRSQPITRPFQWETELPRALWLLVGN